MKTNFSLIQMTGNAHTDALREYEAAHKVWMDTSVFTEAGREARRRLDAAREKYTAAVKAAHPDWIVA